MAANTSTPLSVRLNDCPFSRVNLNMSRILPIVVAVPAVLIAGYVHGRWTDRWMPSRAVELAVARLNNVPIKFGPWQGHDQKLSAETIKRAGIDGYVMRRYEAPGQGIVSVLLVCGRPGPIAAHTPEVCYDGAGYSAIAEPAQLAIPLGLARDHDRLFSSIFARLESPRPAALRLIWAWNGDGTWETSNHPRLTFAKYRCLYKIYLVRDLPTGDVHTDDDVPIKFAEALLPELNKSLF